MPRGRRYKEGDLPEVEPKGEHKMPPLILDGREGSNTRKPSVWITFLKEREVGESFVAQSYPIRQIIKQTAKRMGIVIVDRVLTESPWTYRMWIHSKDGVVSPTYTKRNGKTYRLEEVEDHEINEG